MTMPFSLCATCGVEHQHPLPDICAICDDERQYLPLDGLQRWIKLAELQSDHSTEIWEIEPGLQGFRTTPSVGIGHRPLLVQTPNGNLLWDPPAYIDDAAIARVHELGGIRWIAGSHPHMYGVQLEWSAAFDDAPVYINARDKEWVARSGEAIEEWEDELALAPNLKLIRVGGHFPGMTVVHWIGADDTGVLLSSDAIVPVPDRGWATFLRSYPNQIPLSVLAVQRIADRVRDLPFDRLYGNFTERVCPSGASEMVERSADRYIRWISGEFDHLI